MRLLKTIILLCSCFSAGVMRSQDAVFWHEYTLKNMSLDQKIGQLFMVAAYSNRDAAHTAEIESLIYNYHIGGLIFFQDDPLKQAYLTNYFQSLSKTPLMIGIDGEWGLAMRLKNTQKFPYAVTLGALANDSLMYEAGAAIARQCKRMGIHINFAPDVDINSDPDNPIIGFRAFGDNKYRVAKLGAAYSKGMMSENVLSCAKHFPGHGDVHVDSHHDLPVVDKPLSQLDTAELYPFRYLIEEGVPAIMVAHMHFPYLDGRTNRSTSLSKYVIDTLLKKNMKFEGLVFTDALNMKGVSKYFAPGYADLEAILAGNDVLLFSENVPAAFALIKQAIQSGQFSEAELDKRVLKILRWKRFAGLEKYAPLDLKNLSLDLEGNDNFKLLEDIARNTVSIARDSQGLLPLLNADKTIVVTIGEASPSWRESLQTYKLNRFISVPKNASAEKRASVIKQLAGYNTVIISLHQPKVWSQKTAGYTAADYALINQISKTKNVIVTGFCNPYALQQVSKHVSIIAAYEDLSFYHRAAADIIFGAIKSKGILPVKLSFSEAGGNIRNRFMPGRSGVDSNMLRNVDAIAAELIKKKGAPGCRLYVLKDGREVYNKSYGHLNYDKKKKVNDSTMYDIASITKIASTTLAAMKLFDEGKLDLYKTLGDYLPAVKGTNKEKLVISDILQHRAGLTAWIPFYKETLPYRDSIYKPFQDSLFIFKVADKLYMRKSNRDTIYKRIFDSQLESRVYRYSDLSMILMQLVVESISGKALDVYVNENFFVPMGLSHIAFNPWKKYDVNNIAPTQEDRLFRQQTICGYVHDPGAAMLGGVSGHAGIFSTVQDLASVMLMLNNEGVYYGKQYILPSTIKRFTSYQRDDSRRGLGFDKPDFSGRTSPSSTRGSKATFGHTGFTGTCAWADPVNNLVFVFLSNRICPDEENKELISGNYRTRMQDLVYQSIGK